MIKDIFGSVFFEKIFAWEKRKKKKKKKRVMKKREKSRRPHRPGSFQDSGVKLLGIGGGQRRYDSDMQNYVLQCRFMLCPSSNDAVNSFLCGSEAKCQQYSVEDK